MPIDHKRINAPDDAVPYSLYTKLNTKTLAQQFEDTLQDESRTKLRTSEHRKITLKTGVVSQAKGSAYIEQGETKVIVSVFDPREIPNKPDYSLKGEIYCEFKFAPFSCPKRRLHQQDAEEKQYSGIMKQALEATVCRHEFPNFQVDVYALVLHNDGSALSAAITAAGLALAHAGVPMYDLITSVTVGIQQKHVLLDPTAIEEELCQISISHDEDNDNHGLIVMSVLSVHDQVPQFYQTGNLCLSDLKDTIELATKVCQNIVPLVQKNLVKFVVKNLKNKTV